MEFKPFILLFEGLIHKEMSILVNIMFDVGRHENFICTMCIEISLVIQYKTNKVCVELP